jgi:hypothetical protein
MHAMSPYKVQYKNKYIQLRTKSRKRTLWQRPGTIKKKGEKNKRSKWERSRSSEGNTVDQGLV